ncbi:hypothetical protein BST42_23645 [Mycolicibacterium rhodesiae]|uniref:Uncharacterized protein n=2 Tax=Mycolicibacterium rhodesiae TaxID=36814 RepID=A0A1X0IMB3_MYCRH|nr:hypothetical protein BST42_23645 [Mycolicibacterium rhodesiae]
MRRFKRAKFSERRNGEPLPVVLWCPGGNVPDGLLSATERAEVLVLDSRDPGYEMGALHRASATYSRFVFLKDSVTILKPDIFWPIVDSVDGPVWLSAPPSMYLGIYDSRIFMRKMDRANTDTKFDSIEWEWKFRRSFNWPVLWPDIGDTTAKRVDYIEGQPELVVGNEIWEKHKGSVNWCGKCETCVKLKRHLSVSGICEKLLKEFV